MLPLFITLKPLCVDLIVYRHSPEELAFIHDKSVGLRDNLGLIIYQTKPWGGGGGTLKWKH